MRWQRAPARGRYDRGQSRAERFREQHLRLLAAAVQAALEGSETVTRVVTIAGVGRSTFHEFFDDFAHALSVARTRALKEMRAALATVPNNAHWLDGVVSAWIDSVRAEPEFALVALRVSGDHTTSELGSVFMEALGSVVLSGARASERVELELALAAAAAEGCARDVALQTRISSGASVTDVTQVKRLLLATVQGLLAGLPRDKI